MSFRVSAEKYHAFMGGFSEPLAQEFLGFAGLDPGSRVLDVGCGPGALTEQLVRRVGAARVSAIDPSPEFVAAARDRFDGVDVREAAAEALPYPDGTFDAALGQLVVHFFADPVGGLHEMARVTRPGGTVAACVWDHSDGGGPLSGFWSAVRELDPAAGGEADLPGAREGDLVRLAGEAGLGDIVGGRVGVTRTFATFDDWWEPYLYGIGPAGQYVAGLDPAHLRELRDHCAEKFGSSASTGAAFAGAPFDIPAAAWAVRGTVT